MKSGNLNFLEPSGPLQACKRDCFTLYQHKLFLCIHQVIYIYIHIYHKPYHLKVHKLDKKGKEEFSVRDYDSADEFEYL